MYVNPLEVPKRKQSHHWQGNFQRWPQLGWLSFQCSMKDGTEACNSMKHHLLKSEYHSQKCRSVASFIGKPRKRHHFQISGTERIFCNAEHRLTNTVVISWGGSSGSLHSVQALGRHSDRETFTLK